MGAGQNTIKREQRVKGTDLVMGEERRGGGEGRGAVLRARAPHNERLNFLWPGWHTKSTHPGSVERERRSSERGERTDCTVREGGRRNGNNRLSKRRRQRRRRGRDFNEGQGR